jgi:hypothetical protein
MHGRLAVLALVLVGCSTNADDAASQEGNATGAPAACNDGARNGGETGVDCGGTCKACDGAKCGSAKDCSSGDCGSGKCAASPGKTCGVGTSTTCADGAACQTDSDCTSDYCDASGKCTAPSDDAHTDGRRNAGESDVDCGAAAGVACEIGLACKSADDCISTCTSGVCDAPSDADGKKNQDETDVDCGGPNAKKCGLAKSCAADGDCGLGFCSSNACAQPAPNDGILNGTETDVDCGGAAQTYDGVTVAAAPACAVAKKCLADTDCTSAVCAETKLCVEAPSCRPIHGGATCGAGEYDDPKKSHESCCKSYPVPGITMVQGGVSKQVYLDKYEITAGRVRAFVADIEKQYGGVPNVQAWVKARMAVDPILASQFPGNDADFLPSKASGQLATFPYVGGGTVQVDLGLDDQIGPTSYYRGTQVGGTSGCYMGAGAYGHRTYWYDKAKSDAFGEVFRGDAMKDVLDEKSMNCMTPIMFAAFCAWDGGYMQSQTVIATAYGPNQWPWGDLPAMNDAAAKMGNYNLNTSFGATDPRYLFPIVDYGTFANDFSPIIAAPGRFPKDVATKSGRPANDTWMDLGGNMIEWNVQGGAYNGWTGSSFEGHYYPRLWNSAVYFLDKYGKGSARCMRLR